jgi:hypothetical protein
VTFKDRDRGYSKRIKSLKKLGAKQHAVTVGVHEEEGSEQHEESDLSIADIAAIQEFGAESVGIPSRSFIRDWSDENEADNKQTLKTLTEATVAGKIPDIDTALDQAGAKFAGDVKKRIIAHIPPENAPSTIEQKGTSTPLIGETTQLLSAITWKVEK